MIIRRATDADLIDVLSVERGAFKSNSESNLVKNILVDPSAKPILSLIAIVNNQTVGHILFTNAHLSDKSSQLVLSILAPLAVRPEFQKKGIGSALIKKGLNILERSGVELVFVIGHPEYYPKHGFVPAIPLGFHPPYQIPKEVENAWMVKAMQLNILGKNSGKVICCDALNKPEYWQE